MEAYNGLQDHQEHEQWPRNELMHSHFDIAISQDSGMSYDRPQRTIIKHMKNDHYYQCHFHDV